MADDSVPRLVRKAKDTRYLVCCACGKSCGVNFYRLDQMSDGSFASNGRPCDIEPSKIRSIAYANSPYLCHACYLSTCSRLRGLACDVCGSLNVPMLRYAVSRKMGVTRIGPHQSFIFEGEIKSGRACCNCYSRNRRALTQHRLESKDSTRKDDEAFDDDDDEQEMHPPAKKKRVTSLSAAIHDTTATTITPSLQEPPPLAQVLPIVETLVSIEKAGLQTISIKETVAGFLLQRERMREAMSVVVQTEFNVDAFVAMQEYFLAMLDNQLRVIENDRQQCAAQLTLARK